MHEKNSIVKVFDFNDDMVRVVEKDGELWWVAKDICQVLGIDASSGHALDGLDDDEKGRCQIPTLGGQQELATVNEPGLYTLTLRSRKPQAKPFIRWVTHELIPTVRKTGRYELNTERGVDWIERETQGAIRLAALFGLTGNQGLLAASNVIRKLYGQDPIALLGAPLEAPTQEQLMTPSDIGTKFEPPMHGTAVNKLLASEGLQTSSRDAKKRIVWEPTEAGKEFSVMLDTGKAHTDGTPVRQLKWRSSIVGRLMRLP